MNKLITALLVILVIYFGYRYKQRSTPLELPKYTHLSCLGTAYDVKVKFKSSALLLSSALPTSEEELNSIYFGISYFQNLYTFTNLKEINEGSILKWVSLSNDPKIKILSVEDTKYPAHVELGDAPVISGFPEQQTNYIKRLFATKNILKDAPAKKVNYEYENDVQICLTEKSIEKFSQLDFIQPLDPYMAYYLVPEVQRRNISNEILKTTAVVNPCLNPHSVSSSGVNPFGYWYHWWPKAQGHGNDNVSFDCSLYYKNNSTIQNVQVSVTENTPAPTTQPDFEKLKNLERPIKASIYFGAYNSTDFTAFNKADVESYFKTYLSDIDLHTARKELPINSEKYDAALSKLLILLWNVKSHIEVKDYAFDVGTYHATVTLRGKLKLSKKDLELKLSASRNQPDKEGSEYFGKSFAQDLFQRDILIYDGHASYGNIFENVFKSVKDISADQKNNLHYQLLALYSCSSGYYFNSQNFSIAQGPDFKRDTVRTGGGFMDPTGNSSLAVLGTLDNYLYNENQVPFSYWAKTFKSDNFYILTND